MKLHRLIVVLATLLLAPIAWAGFVTFESAAGSPGGITPTRDAFRIAVGGGTVAGANGLFGGVRREINWDGVPDALSDPNALPANFFNSTSPRGVEFSTPGTGFLVSANAGLTTPTLFGFGGDFQTFSAQKLFTAVGSNITDVRFFVPGTSTAATTSAFGVIFVDVEVAGQTTLEFFNASNVLIFTREALVAGNQGLSFVGALANAGERISRVRLTSGRNSILSNGVLSNSIDDVVVMDDFLFAEPLPRNAVPEPSSLALFALALALAACAAFLRLRTSRARTGAGQIRA